MLPACRGIPLIPALPLHTPRLMKPGNLNQVCVCTFLSWFIALCLCFCCFLCCLCRLLLLIAGPGCPLCVAGLCCCPMILSTTCLGLRSVSDSSDYAFAINSVLFCLFAFSRQRRPYTEQHIMTFVCIQSCNSTLIITPIAHQLTVVLHFTANCLAVPR